MPEPDVPSSRLVPPSSNARERPGKPVLEQIASLSGVFTAMAALFAAAAYTILTFAVRRVYSGVAVDPSEIGLGYTSLLPASAPIMALVLSPFVLFAAVGFMVIRRTAQIRREIEGLSEDHDFRKTIQRYERRFLRFVWLALVVSAVYSVAVAIAFVRPDVGAARRDLSAGRAHDSLGPWRFHTASASWLKNSSSRPDLPACVLLLGRADNVVVLLDPKTQNTLRIPTAEVLTVSDPHAKRC